MILKIRRKWWSWGDDFVVLDELGNKRYDIDGKVFSWGDRLSIRETDGDRVVEIDQRLLAWGPTYDLYHQGEKMAIVYRKAFQGSIGRFGIHVPGPEDLEIEGDFSNRHYRFHRRGLIHADVQPESQDLLRLEIQPFANRLLIVACTVVMELLYEDIDIKQPKSE